MRIAPWLVRSLLVACCTACCGGTGVQGHEHSTGSSTTGGSLVGCLTINQPTLDLGQSLIGESVTAFVTLSNSCSDDVTGITAGVSGPDVALFSATPPTTLAAGTRAPVIIRYAPVNLGAPSTATIQLIGARGATAALDVSGQPIVVSIAIAPNPLVIAFVLGTPATACSTVTNRSDVAVELAAVSFKSNEDTAFALSLTDGASPPNPAPIPTTIPPGESAKVCFSLTLPSAKFFHADAILTFLGTSGSSWNVVTDLPLNAFGTGPQITCTPQAVPFGPTIEHSVSTLKLLCQNTGTSGSLLSVAIVPLADTSVFKATVDAASDAVSGGGIYPGQSDWIDVSYSPTGTGNDQDTLVLETNTYQGAIQIPLSGQGVAVPPCQFVLAPTSLDFTDVPVGTTSPTLSIEIQNVGDDLCLIDGLLGDLSNGFSVVSSSIAPDVVTGTIAIPAPGPGVTSSVTLGIDLTCTTPGPVSSELKVSGASAALTGTCG